MKKLPPLFLVLLTAMPFPLSAEPADILAARLEALQDQYEIVGLSAVAVRDGAVVWQASRGFADLERSRPVTDETKFRIASISKIATATALMQLWEQGKFQLDDDISLLLGYPVINPSFPNDPITVRQLLTHTSSLRDGPNYDRFLMATYRAGAEARSLRELLHAEGESYNEGANFAAHRPGETYEYCNLNFGVIGTLVERLSGERFDDYCRRNIFEPLGMVASFNEADLPEIDLLGVLYRPGPGGWEPQFDNHGGKPVVNRIGPAYPPGQNGIVFSPQGGLRTSALDLAKLMAQFLPPFSGETTPRVVKPATVALMLEEHWSNGAKGSAYRGRGLGFQRIHLEGRASLWIGHGGRAYGLLARMYFEAGGETGIIVVTNGSRPGEELGEMHAMEHDLLAAIDEYLRADRP